MRPPGPGARSPWATGSVALSGASLVNERAVLPDAHPDRLKRLARRHPAQQPLGDVRQQRVGEDVVHVARAAFHLGAAPRHLLDEGVVVNQIDLVVLPQAPLDLRELQFDGSGEVSGSAVSFINSSVQAFVVSRMIVFLKSISRPSPSSIMPLSNTW